MKKFISLIGFLCFFIAESIAGVSISQFAIRSGYASGDKLVANAGQPTTFIVDATLVHAGTTYNMARVTVVYQENNVDTELSEELWKSDWSTGSGIWQPVINATLPAGKTAGKIYLKLQTWEGSNQGPTNYSNISYGIQVSGTNPGGGTSPIIGTPPAFTAPVAGAVPLYQYNSSTKRLLTTIYYSLHPEYAYNGILGYVFTSQVLGTVPLYWFVNTTNGNNYYTIVNEGSISGYSSKGIACYVYPSQVSKSLPIYEHHIVNAPWHLYVNVPGIMTGFVLHDIRFYILQNKQVTTYPLPEEDCEEVYRYYNSSIGDHYYTTSKRSYPGYVYEGILGYVSTIQKPGTVPLYRYWNETDGDHYYPLVKQDYSGYVYEGIVGYVYPNSGVNGTAPVYSYYSDGDTDHYYEMLNSNFSGYVNEGIRFYMLQYNH